MTGVIATIPKYQFSSNGVPMVGGTLETYLAGSTTPENTYQDQALSIANANPIILDSRGECVLWLDQTKQYKFVLKNKQGVAQWTVDNISGAGATLDAALRAALSATSGASMIGYTQSGTGAVSTTVESVLRESVSLTRFGAITGVDDTATLQKALNYIAANTAAELITVGGVSSCYAATLPKLKLPKGRLKITSALTVPAYIDIDADGTIIEQATAGADIFVGEAYQWKVKGVIFVGGRNQVSLYNANVDSSLFDFVACEFHLSSDYAVKTAATGGTYQHLSANLTFRKCRFMKPKRILDNCCDSALFDDCWVSLDKANFDASSAAIRNRAPTSHPRLFLRNFFGVPSMGTAGVDRLANVRWIDNQGSVYATGCRFGGEYAGMSILWHQVAAPTTTPYLGYEVVFDGCWLYAGPSSRSDSGVVLLDGQVPQRISIKNCMGPSDVPFVINPSAFSLPTYFSTWETATGKKAYNYFSVDIRGNNANSPDGTIYSLRLPDGLRPYVVGGKKTKVSRVLSAQTVSNGFVNNLVSFDTLNYDNMGGWAAASPTRLVLPAGVTKARITVHAVVSNPSGANTVAVRILNSALATQAGSEVAGNVNADGNQYSVTAEVDGAPGDYFHVSVLTNSTGALSLATCIATITALDYVG